MAACMDEVFAGLALRLDAEVRMDAIDASRDLEQRKAPDLSGAL